jgi:hypothetical protein
MTPLSFHGKEGVVGSSPTEGFQALFGGVAIGDAQLFIAIPRMLIVG